MSALDCLSELAGAEPGYHDIQGVWHEADDDDRKVVLTAMGLDVSSPEAIEASLEELEMRPWRRALEPVFVMRNTGGDYYPVTVVLPLDELEKPLRWTLALEGSKAIKGEVLPIRLRRGDQRDVDGVTVERRFVDLPGDLPEGYHHLSIKCGKTSARTTVIIAPPHAYQPPWQDDGQRLWGVNSHLYSVRCTEDWGMGDFTTLTKVVRSMGGRGAQVVGINPLHALFKDKPEEASPYSPSNRLFLNPLYIDVQAVPEWNAKTDMRGRATALKKVRAATHVNYTGVAKLKWPLLEKMHERFQAHPEDHPRKAAFRSYLGEMGGALRRFAVFFCLREHFGGQNWHNWPKEYQTSASRTVLKFAKDHADRIEFYEFLQFEADRQLGLAAKACDDAGMAVGLYRDLAVGSTPDGSATWGGGDIFAEGLYFGAPPDAFNPKGQDWGLPPYNPLRLRETAFAPFIALLRHNMRHAGALRIDHAMSLMRLFWILPGTGKGAYVRYPFDDMLAIVALESQRNECVVIGEDLGTVPPIFREHMDHENLLSYRLLYFERWKSGLFIRPEDYPAKALATVTTHDLATLRGCWEEADVGVMDKLGLLSCPREVAQEDRARDRAMMVSAVTDQGLLPNGFPLVRELNQDQLVEMSVAIHRYLARSKAALMLVNLDDLSMEPEQLNVPGTIDEYPNWRRRISVDIETLAEAPQTEAILNGIKAERG